MKAQPFVVTAKDYAPALNVLGIRLTVLASNTATQGYEITRQQGEKGMGPPPHSHNWDESFYIVAGGVHLRRQDHGMPTRHACARAGRHSS